MSRTEHSDPSSLKVTGTDDSAFVYEVLADHFPCRDVRDLSMSELSFLIRQAQRLKEARRS